MATNKATIINENMKFPNNAKNLDLTKIAALRQNIGLSSAVFRLEYVTYGIKKQKRGSKTSNSDVFFN